jgi:hypothetical protein
MSRVEQLENQIAALAPEEFRELARWMQDREEDAWDAQMEADAAAGKLDFLIAEADEAAAKGELLEWPTPEKP